MTLTKLISLELYADLVCPWCWIGDRRLWRALVRAQESYPEVGFDVIWRPFQLDPSLPPEGRDWGEVIEAKFGGRARAEPMFARVSEAGIADGCTFAFDRITRMSNTARAHGLVLHAQQTERNPWPLVDELFGAHFTNGADLGNPETLTGLARAFGFHDVDTESVLKGRYDQDVEQSQREAAGLGIQGVPFLVMDGRYGVGGAQPESVFFEALSRLVAES